MFVVATWPVCVCGRSFCIARFSCKALFLPAHPAAALTADPPTGRAPRYPASALNQLTGAVPGDRQSRCNTICLHCSVSPDYSSGWCRFASNALRPRKLDTHQPLRKEPLPRMDDAFTCPTKLTHSILYPLGILCEEPLPRMDAAFTGPTKLTHSSHWFWFIFCPEDLAG